MIKMDKDELGDILTQADKIAARLVETENPKSEESKNPLTITEDQQRVKNVRKELDYDQPLPMRTEYRSRIKRNQGGDDRRRANRSWANN